MSQESRRMFNCALVDKNQSRLSFGATMDKGLGRFSFGAPIDKDQGRVLENVAPVDNDVGMAAPKDKDI
jgi:hypothetical protein